MFEYRSSWVVIDRLPDISELAFPQQNKSNSVRVNARITRYGMGKTWRDCSKGINFQL